MKICKHQGGAEIKETSPGRFLLVIDWGIGRDQAAARLHRRVPTGGNFTLIALPSQANEKKYSNFTGDRCAFSSGLNETWISSEVGWCGGGSRSGSRLGSAMPELRSVGSWQPGRPRLDVRSGQQGMLENWRARELESIFLEENQQTPV